MVDTAVQSQSTMSDEGVNSESQVDEETGKQADPQIESSSQQDALKGDAKSQRRRVKTGCLSMPNSYRIEFINLPMQLVEKDA